MNLTIFAKKLTNQEGKSFYRYLSTLTRKDGSTQTVAVKFREDCGSPKGDKCPMNILVDRKDMNMTSHEYEREDTGEVAKGYTVWVSAWKEGAPYEDHSMDEFVD